MKRFLLLAICHFLFNCNCSTLAAGVATNTADDYLRLGDHALSNGEFDQAIQNYHKGLERLEDTSLTVEISLHTNLATAFSSQGDDEKAAINYQNALLAYKKGIDEIVDKYMKEEATQLAAQSAFYLGMAYQDLNQAVDAVDAYQYATVLDPGLWAAYANLGAVYHDLLTDHRRALDAYNQAYDLLTTEHAFQITNPPPESRYIKSQLQYRIGLCLSHDVTRTCVVQKDGDTQENVDCSQLATHAFSLAVSYDPENESAQHMLATLTADATMKRASNRYVKELFDDYAPNFEHSLVKELGYDGYQRLRRVFNRALNIDHDSNELVRFKLVVDAGCGTGLVGEQFRNVSQVLIGVDLSEAILFEAKKARPNLYDEMIAGDVTQVFRDKDNTISLIIAGDSYIYFGDLEPLFESMQVGLEEGGYAAFTLENVSAENEAQLATSKPDWRWQLTPSGRFAHRKEYVLSEAVAHGFELVHYESMDDFRFERGVGVRGHVFVLRKTPKEDREL